MKKVLLLGAALVALTACSKNAKRTMGLTETLPDEYKVSKNKPLEVPPFYQGSAAKKQENKKQEKSMSKEEEALLKEIE
jgi:hypothetical protein